MNGLRVFSFFFLQEQLELRAHSEIKPGWWPLWDTTCLFLSHESQRLPPPSSSPLLLPTSSSPLQALQLPPQMFVNTKIAHRCENYDVPPSACVGSPRDANFPSESAVPFVSRGFNFGAASVFHGPGLWQAAMAPISLRTLWDSGCIQVVMGYIKRKWIHMWGLALVLGTLTLLSLKKSREEGRALTLPPRTPSGPGVGIHNNCVRLWFLFFGGGGEFELQEARTADTSESLLFCWRVIRGRQ